MLNSIKPIVDLIVINDTGSTDNTIYLINKWGEDNNIPTYVYQRQFDNFENSRNNFSFLEQNTNSFDSSRKVL